MTRYSAEPAAYPECPDYRDRPESMIIHGYTYIPAAPNPADCPESYRPVRLQFGHDYDDPWGTVTIATAVNGHRANRTYRVITPGATQTYGIAVNGVMIPVEFNTVRDAERFAQAIEDYNTED